MPGAVAVLLLDEIGQGLVGQLGMLLSAQKGVGGQGCGFDGTGLARTAHVGGDAARPVRAVAFDGGHRRQFVQGGLGAAALRIGGGQRVGHQRQRIGVFGLAPELADIVQATLGAGFVLVPRLGQRPDDIGRHRQLGVAQVAPRLFVDQALVVLPTAVGALLG